jgi:hypothetical protein
MDVSRTTGWASCTSFAGFVILGTASLGNEKAGLVGGMVIFALFFAINWIGDAVVRLWNGTGAPYIHYSDKSFYAAKMTERRAHW